MARPELARPVQGAPGLLAELARRHALVAVVSGRPAEQVRTLLGPVPVEVYGHYGLSPEAARPPAGLRAEVERVAAAVEGARVEDKGASLAVHVREAPDPEGAERGLEGPLREAAARHGWRVLPGKLVLEVAPAETPGKGSVVAEAVRLHGLDGVLYAGDDRADLEAFEALHRLAAEGRATVAVAVASPEAPEELLARADLVVEGPSGLLRFLETV